MTGAYITVLRTIIGTLVSLVANALLAFIVSRKRFLFRSQLSLFWVITMYVNGGMIPTFLVYRGFHLTGTFWVYIVPGAVSAFNMLVMRTYMLGLPDSLEESAQLDGAGYFTIFTRIISPLCKPVYATVALFVAVGQWNSWFDAYLFTNSQSLKTMQSILVEILNQYQSSSANQAANQASQTITPDSIRMAATMVATIPIIMVYPFIQKYFVKGIMLGSVKS